jgi:hypothetical protein
MDHILDWLLEKDNPSVRYFTLKYLLGGAETDPEVRATRRAIMRSGPVTAILAGQQAEGYWAKPGSGYSPKYRATTWQILWLAELGADGQHRQIRQGCEYVLSHAQARHGGFSALAQVTPNGAIHCLNGNLIWALVALGYSGDERLQKAVAWLTGSITGEGFQEWFASGVTGPGFCCAANGGRPCAWGAVKALRALAAWPDAAGAAHTRSALERAAEFLLSHNLVRADYPASQRVSGEWFKFGFPLSYTSDILEAALALSEAGYGADPRLQPAVEFIRSQRETGGSWRMRHSLNGKLWADIEQKGQPSKWVTLRALRVIKMTAPAVHLI